MKTSESMIKLLLRNPAMQIVVYIAMFFALLLLSMQIATMISPGMFTHHNAPSEMLLLLQEIAQSIISVACLLFCIKFLQRRSIRSTGIVRQGAVLETLIGFAVGFLVAGGAILGMYLLGVYHPESIDLSANLFYPLILFWFAALTEEVIFRIYIFQTCERHWGTVKALIITATAFGLVHMMNSVPHNFDEKLAGCIFLIFEAGFLLNAAFLIKRRIWLPLGMHWAWNFFEGPVFGGIVSGHNLSVPFVHASVSGPFLYTGGDFGPEASLPGLLVGTACGAVAAWYAFHKGAWKMDKSAQSPEPSTIPPRSG